MSSSALAIWKRHEDVITKGSISFRLKQIIIITKSTPLILLTIAHFKHSVVIMCLNNRCVHLFHIGNLKDFRVCAKCCCFTQTLSSVDACVSKPRGCSPSTSDQAPFATFIQFLHCSDIEALTWKWPTPGCDLMFPNHKDLTLPTETEHGWRVSH